MATFENLQRPSDVLEATPQSALVRQAFTKTPSSVSANSAYAAGVLGRTSGVSAPLGRREADSSRPSGNTLHVMASPSPDSSCPPSPPGGLLHGPLSNYINSLRAVSRNSLYDETSFPDEDIKSRLSNHSLTSEPSNSVSSLPNDKTQFIIALKEELKKHDTIPDNFNKLGFFQELYKLLADEVWEIRNEATLLILDLLPYLKTDLDTCMSIVLPNLIPNLGDGRVRLQKSSVKLLSAYSFVSRDKEGLVEDLVTYGVNHKDKKVSKLATLNVIHLLKEDLSDVDLSSLAQSLYRKTYDAEVKPAAVPTLRELRSLVGGVKFYRFLNSISWHSRERLDQLMEAAEAGASERHSDGETRDDDEDVVIHSRSEHTAGSSREGGSSRQRMEFGIVDGGIMDKIRHRTDWKTRSEGCEQLRALVKSLHDATPLLPYLPNFLSLLDSLIDDNNFRISMTVLDIFRILIDILQTNLPTYLRQIVHSVVKHVGDSKVVVRMENMRVFQRLVQTATPPAVIPILCENLNHRSSRVREDCINLIIYALITFPSYEFDLNDLAERVSGSVADPKRRVRQAALECMAAIAQFLGPAKLGSLMAAVDKVEDEEDADGAMAAVQARLARRQLPRVSPDGLIQYSLAVPSSSRRNNFALPKGADVDWVLAGSGSVSAASLGGSSSGGPLSGSLSSSFTASDSYVNTLAYNHPQSSPSPRSRLMSQESLHKKRSFSDVALNKSVWHNVANITDNIIRVDQVLDGGASSVLVVVVDVARGGPPATPLPLLPPLNMSILQDERGLALWATDTIDLSKTAPSDLGGYRGVYLGKLRQGSSYSRGITVEKGYSLLPNKYGGSGLGSARGERPGSRSPTLHRRINALAPLDQGESVITVSRAGSTRSVIPPLSAVSRRSTRRSSSSGKNDTLSDPDDDLDQHDDKSDYCYEEDEDDETEIEEEEVEEEVLVEEGPGSRPKSSATTRDSGISVYSGPNEADPPTENGKEERRETARGGRDSRRTLQAKDSASSLSSLDDYGRSSYDVGVPAGRKVGEKQLSPSTQSLPNHTQQQRSSGLGVIAKGLGGGGGRHHAPAPWQKDFPNFDYESDFETDEEDPNNITLANTTLTKMKLLKKKRENLKEIERRRQERDSRRTQEERARKYRQLEMQHSQNSLQPSRANSGESNLAVQPNLSYKGRTLAASPHLSPRRNLRPSPGASPRPSPAPSPPAHRRLPKSKSHNSNLSKSLGRSVASTEKRHRSLDRHVNSQANGVHTRETFRTPQIVKRGHPPTVGSGGSHLSSSLGSTGGSTSLARRSNRRLPDRSSDDLSTAIASVGMRSSKPSSSCFKAHLEPFANPSEALKNSHHLLSSGDWESQVDGIEIMVRLIEHHPEVVQTDLHNVNIALMKQAKNLRSQVSRAAIQAFTRLFDTLKRNMESDSEKIAGMLLHRTADTNKFLQLDSHHALDAILENISPTKAIPAIIQEGLSHKNAAVRTTVARLLAYEVQRLGPSRVLSGQKDITDRLLPAAAKLAQEGSLETRQYAKHIFQQLIQQGQFDAALKKHVSATEIRNLQKLLDNLTNEGRTIQESARSKYASGSRYTRTM